MGDNVGVTSTTLPSRLIGVADRIPRSLQELVGPASGSVDLPTRLAWSGLRQFDVTDPAQRLTLYRMLMDCGQLHDIATYVNSEFLVRDWPRIRRLTARRLVALWEKRLPELASS